MCVEHRCFQVLVAEQFIIISSDIITVRKHMSGDHGAINDQANSVNPSLYASSGVRRLKGFRNESIVGA